MGTIHFDLTVLRTVSDACPHQERGRYFLEREMALLAMKEETLSNDVVFGRTAPSPAFFLHGELVGGTWWRVTRPGQRPSTRVYGENGNSDPKEDRT